MGEERDDDVGATCTSGVEIEQLVREYSPMAERLARRFSNSWPIDPDLRQVADMGLFLAAKRFDPAAGPFRPFAMVTIVGELKKHLRANGWTAKVPRRVQEATITVTTASERLEQALRRSPTPAEVATETGLSVETVLVALQARNARFSAQDGADQEHISNAMELVEARIDVGEATSVLSSASRELLHLRYEQELTQRQIAERLNISQTAVHRRLTKTLDELRSAMEPPGKDHT